MTTSQRPVFGGFSLPAGAWLPPELVDLLPEIKSLGELKVTILSIYETMRVGGSEAIIPLSSFEGLGGMTRNTVLAGIRSAIARGTVERRSVGNTHAYRLCVANRDAVRGDTGRGSESAPPGGSQIELFGAKSEPISRENEPIGSDSRLNACMHESLPSSKGALEKEKHAEPARGREIAALGEPSGDPAEKRTLVRLIHELGVAVKVAEDLVSKYAPEYLVEKVRHLKHRMGREVVRKPAGWFVASVRDNYGEPEGFDALQWCETEKERRAIIKARYCPAGYNIQGWVDDEEEEEDEREGSGVRGGGCGAAGGCGSGAGGADGDHSDGVEPGGPAHDRD